MLGTLLDTRFNKYEQTDEVPTFTDDIVVMELVGKKKSYIRM